MWESYCHNWNALHGNDTRRDVHELLARVLDSNDDEVWLVALRQLAAYAANQGFPSDATQGVVACLVACVVRTDGNKRSEILVTLEELTCGLGIEEYGPQEFAWLRAAVHELAYGLHTWAHIAESGTGRDAVTCVEMLAYCSVYVPELSEKAETYLQLCAASRPELREDIEALAVNATEVRQLLRQREHA